MEGAPLLMVYTIGVGIHGFSVFGGMLSGRNSNTLSAWVMTWSMYKACTAAKQSSTRKWPLGSFSHCSPTVRVVVTGGLGVVTFAGNAAEKARLRGEAEVRVRRVRTKNIIYSQCSYGLTTLGNYVSAEGPLMPIQLHV